MHLVISIGDHSRIALYVDDHIPRRAEHGLPQKRAVLNGKTRNGQERQPLVFGVRAHAERAARNAARYRLDLYIQRLAHILGRVDKKRGLAVQSVAAVRLPVDTHGKSDRAVERPRQHAVCQTYHRITQKPPQNTPPPHCAFRKPTIGRRTERRTYFAVLF